MLQEINSSFKNLYLDMINNSCDKFGKATCFIMFLALIALVCALICVFKHFEVQNDLFAFASALIAAAAITYSQHQAAAAITYSQHQIDLEKNRNNSKFYLEKYIQALDKILKCLKDDIPTRPNAWFFAESIAEKVNCF